MTRVERLLDLVAYLLNSREPVAWTHLQEAFPEEYAGGGEAACRRKFERDKADLLDLGIPLRMRDEDEFGKLPEPGYYIDSRAYYLPELKFTPLELAAVYLACRALLEDRSFPFSARIKTAMEKLWSGTRTRLDDEALSLCRSVSFLYLAKPAGGKTKNIIADLEGAVSARKRVEMVYHSIHSGATEKRSVDPYGIFCWHGSWMLVGFCRLRGAIRVFSTARIKKLKVNSARPKTPDFQVPSDFKLESYMHMRPMNFTMHEPIEVEIAVREDFSFLARQSLDARAAGKRDGWDIFKLSVTNTDALIGWVLLMGANARFDSPPWLRDSIVKTLRTIAARHRGG